MQAFEYLAGLFTIIIGLAVVDIANSFHMLMRIRASLRWNPLVLLAAVYALLLTITMWFKLWSVRGFAEAGNYLFSLSLCIEYLLLFLIAAASLPDDPHAGIDLRRFYAENRRYLWGLVVLYQVSNVGHAAYFFTHGEHANPLHTVLGFGLPLAIAVTLFAVRSRAVHYAGVAVLLITLLADRVMDVIR